MLIELVEETAAKYLIFGDKNEAPHARTLIYEACGQLVARDASYLDLDVALSQLPQELQMRVFQQGFGRVLGTLAQMNAEFGECYTASLIEKAQSERKADKLIVDELPATMRGAE